MSDYNSLALSLKSKANTFFMSCHDDISCHDIGGILSTYIVMLITISCNAPKFLIYPGLLTRVMCHRKEKITKTSFHLIY